MPELPEVEVLVRHLRPLLQGKVIRAVQVKRARVLRPTSVRQLTQELVGARFDVLSRRGKFLLFTLCQARRKGSMHLLGHLGMSGRMYLLPKAEPLPKHAAVVLALGDETFVFEDTRYFGRFTLDTSPLAKLGPEPLSSEFTPEVFGEALARSGQPIKVKLLDQTLVAGVGNIYASEALFRGGISPKLPARKLRPKQVRQLWKSIREVLAEAIVQGCTQLLDFNGTKTRDSFFYFGRPQEASESYEERLSVYGRRGELCLICGTRIRHCVQAARSTFYCPHCQAV